MTPSAERLWPAWSWRVLTGLWLVDVLWILIARVSLDLPSAVVLAAAGAAAFAVTAFAARAPLTARARTFAEGLAFLLAAWPALRVLNHLTMTTALPLADARLAAWDAALGFDWLGYVRLLDRHPRLLRLMELTYTGLDWYSVVTAVALLFAFGAERMREFVLAFFAAAVAVVAIGPLFPAYGAMAHYAPDPALFARVTPACGTYYLAALRALRVPGAHALSWRHLPGLATFPSFHAAMGVIGIYCCRGKRPVFLASLALNSFMIASTPLFGSHYLIDLLAGAALALIVAPLAAARR